MKHWIHVFLMVACSARLAVAQSAAEIVSEMDNATSLSRGEMVLTISDVKDGKLKSQFKVSVKMERGKGSLMEFTEPAREKGKRILMVGNDLWMVTPGMSRPLRISGKESFMGTSFSNNDLMDQEKSRNYSAKIVSQNDSSKVVELIANNVSVSYQKIIANVGKAGVPYSWDLFALSGQKIKTVAFEEVKLLGGRKRPSKVTVFDAMSQGRHTEVVYEAMKEGEIDAGQFTPQALVK